MIDLKSKGANTDKFNEMPFRRTISWRTSVVIMTRRNHETYHQQEMECRQPTSRELSWKKPVPGIYCDSASYDDQWIFLPCAAKNNKHALRSFSNNKNLINIHAICACDQNAITIKKKQASTNPMHENYLQVIFPCFFSRSTHTSACSNSRV